MTSVLMNSKGKIETVVLDWDNIAVDEMGMVYPDENEVIEYTEQMREYVRQYENIPKS